MGHVRDQAIHVRSLIKEKRIYYAQMILKTKKRRLRSTRYVPPVLVVDRGVSQTQKGGQKALCATLVENMVTNIVCAPIKCAANAMPKATTG